MRSVHQAWQCLKRQLIEEKFREEVAKKPVDDGLASDLQEHHSELL